MKNARGFAKIFFYMAKAIGYVASIGNYSKQTASVNIFRSINEPLQSIKEDQSNQENQDPSRSL